jgi:hypothetical protein
MGNTTDTRERAMAAKFELGTTVVYTVAYIRQAEMHNGNMPQLHQPAEVIEVDGDYVTIARADGSADRVYTGGTGGAIKRFRG